jgi:hypothetical protein
MMQRFLIVNATNARRGIDRKPDRQAASVMAEALRELASLEGDAPLPPFRFDPQAGLWRNRIEEFAESLNARADIPLPLRGWADKLENEWARIALVLHLLEWATGPEILYSLGGLPSETIPAETAEKAARFLIEFQYPQQATFYRSVAGLGVQADANVRWIASHVLRHGFSEIDARRIYQNCQNLKGKENRPALFEAMETLYMNGWVQPIVSYGSSRNPTAWRINPAVHDGRFAARRASEMVRQAEIQDQMAKAFSARRIATSAECEAPL